ncbi:hypothetical protein [Catellatospora citrea]|uniref:PknH-like protein n=1 Tax=Catellatospora citrea TaxID=53366 RepID=A0A8J3KGR9_9ACTN|nr:hypothetical protein [Catellatospora citrea]RKE11168.1 hypothetical protein C8E86_6092 [Catellatospora citrea]GIF96633.1 hypothetical protein Cci01nite_17270 [Catellatospora citrea]
MRHLTMPVAALLAGVLLTACGPTGGAVGPSGSAAADTASPSAPAAWSIDATQSRAGGDAFTAQAEQQGYKKTETALTASFFLCLSGGARLPAGWTESFAATYAKHQGKDDFAIEVHIAVNDGTGSPAAELLATASSRCPSSQKVSGAQSVNQIIPRTGHNSWLGLGNASLGTFDTGDTWDGFVCLVSRGNALLLVSVLHFPGEGGSTRSRASAQTYLELISEALDKAGQGA